MEESLPVNFSLNVFLFHKMIPLIFLVQSQEALSLNLDVSLKKLCVSKR